MLRLLLAAFLVLHGAIHFAGFVKAFGLAQVTALTAPITKPTGIIWAIAGALFLSAGAFLLLGNGRWWMVTAVALVVSQVLILLNWHDARFGTIANVVLLLALVAIARGWDFQV